MGTVANLGQTSPPQAWSSCTLAGVVAYLGNSPALTDPLLALGLEFANEYAAQSEMARPQAPHSPAVAIA